MQSSVDLIEVDYCISPQFRANHVLDTFSRSTKPVYQKLYIVIVGGGSFLISKKFVVKFRTNELMNVF